MTSSQKPKRKNTLPAIATGIGFAAIWITVSHHLSEKPSTDSEEVSKPTQSRSVSVPPLNPTIVQFREREDRSYRDLATLLRSLPEELSVSDTKALTDWLLNGAEQQITDVGQHAHLVNEVLNLLRAQTPLPENLPDVVLTLAESASQPDLVRDYAFQQMRPLWSEIENQDQKIKLQDALWEAVDSKHATRSGTAFLALHSLGYREGITPEGERALGDQDFQPRVRAILTSEESPMSLQMTALRIVEERSLSSELDLVREVLNQPSLNIAMKLKAISVIAQHGNESDRTLLAELQVQPILKPALDRAMKSLPQ
ncbi:MAG: hypothetical protein ABF334_10360 [Akkermansiaceae bacterium]